MPTSRPSRLKRASCRSMPGLSAAADLTAVGLAGAGAGAPGAAFSISSQLRVLFLSNTAEVRMPFNSTASITSRFSARFSFALRSAARCSTAASCSPDSTRTGPRAAFSGPTSIAGLAPTSPVSAVVIPKPPALTTSGRAKPWSVKRAAQSASLISRTAIFHGTRRLRRCACFSRRWHRGSGRRC